MNERNVAAIEAILREFDPHGDCFDSSGYRRSAEWLASQGVLVPSALTANELYQLGVELVACHMPNERDEGVRAMERIAKGEPA